MPEPAGSNYPFIPSSFAPFNVTVATARDAIAQKLFFATYYANFITYVVVGAIICLLAASSHVLCLAAIITCPDLRRQGNILVTNLVVVGILLSVTAHPLAIASVIYRQYGALPENFCDWNSYYYFVLHSFVWHECLLAVNRLIAIVLPHQYKRFSTRSAVIATVVAGIDFRRRQAILSRIGSHDCINRRSFIRNILCMMKRRFSKSVKFVEAGSVKRKNYLGAGLKPNTNRWKNILKRIF